MPGPARRVGNVRTGRTAVRRRIVWTTAVLAVLLVLPAAPASAAQSTLLAPDGDVTGPTPIEVRFERDFGAERFSEVHATLRRDGERLGQRVQLECRRGCEPTDSRVVFALPDDQEFDPRTGAPFSPEQGLVNGAYQLRVRLLKDSAFQEDETFEHELHLAVRPTAPTDVEAVADGSDVELSWKRAPEPDIDGYRVERREDGAWEEVVTTSETDAVDAPGRGEHRYRVVALRPDGRDGQLEAASDEATVEVDAPRDDDDDDGNGDGADGGGSGADESRDDGEDADPADDGDAQTEDESQDSSDTSSSRRRSRSSDPAQDSDSDGGGGSGIPELSEREGDGEDGFEEELDYDEFESGDPEAADDVQVAAPTGWRGTVDRIFDAERVAVPVAAGLVMTTMGLHLWRWLRIPV